MIKRAEVTLELETDKEIDYSNCTDGEKEFITVPQHIRTGEFSQLLFPD